MIDIAIFILFLLVNLFIGILYRGKSQSFKEYSIGDKKFSTATLTATMVATWASGSYLFNTIEQTYSNGLYFILASLGSAIGLLLTGYVVGPRLAPFLNNVSVADIMGHIYGQRVQVIAALSSVLKSIGFIAIQFKVISKVLPILFGYEGPELTIIAATIITVYAAFGGVKAVTFTDVVQFITFGILLPVLALTIWHHIPSADQVIQVVSNNSKFNFSNVLHWSPELMSSLILMAYYATPGLPPQLFQRLIMSRDIAQMQRSIAYTTGIMLIIDLFIIWITILLLADNSTLEANQVIQYMIHKYAYPGLKGLFGIGIIALAMSTADSALNASSVIVTNDILPPLRIIKKPIVSAAALSTLVLGFLGLILALYIQNILKILLISANFYMPVIIVPMLLTIFGFRTSKRAVLIGIGAGCVTTMCLLFYFKNVNSFFPGMLANLIFLLGSHYLLGEPGGWQKIEKQQPLGIRQVYPKTWRDRLIALKKIKPVVYLEKSLPNKEYYYPLFAFYLLTATYVSLYNVPHGVETEYLTIYRTIQYSILIIATSLFAFPIWPTPLKSKVFLSWLWAFIVFYSLFFVGGMLVILTKFQSDQILIFMLNLVMAVLLLYWPVAVTLALSGIVAAFLLFKWGLHSYLVAGGLSQISFRFGYGVLLFSSFLIALFRYKQAHAKLTARQQLLEKINQETNKRLLKALQYREELLEELKPDEVALFDSTTASYINQVIYRVRNYLRLEVSETTCQKLIEEMMATLELQELSVLPKIIKETQHASLQGDIDKILKLLVNAAFYLQRYQTPGKPILLGLEDTTLGYEVSYIKDYIKEIEALKIIFTTDSKLPVTPELYKIIPDKPVMYLPQSEEDLNLTENARIIDAHYGYFEILSLPTGYTHIYVLPVNVREVRGKVMELIRKPVAADPEELAHPFSIQVEKDLFDKLESAKVDKHTIIKALDLIKRYHSGVKRKSGEPFFTHPISVALIVLQYSQDQDAILAALLHDTVEDTSISLPQLEATFGHTLAFLVRKATNLEDKLKRISLADYENIQRLTYYEDPRAALVKLADRLHNMRTIKGHSSLAKQKNIASETLNFFVPLANYLKLIDIAQELERLSLEVLAKKG
jgi:Na+/proline symporter